MSIIGSSVYALGLFGLLQGGLVANAAPLEYLEKYPSGADVRRFQNEGATKVVVSPLARANGQDELNFPMGVLVDHLNDLEPIPVDIQVATSNYPNHTHINRLKSHVTVNAVIDSCLSGPAELSQLKRLTRPVDVVVLCRTDVQVARAQRLADEVMAQGHITVRVGRSRD